MSDKSPTESRLTVHIAGSVYEVHTMEEFDSELERTGDGLVCVYFTAPWCGPCNLAGPVMDVIAADNTDVVFLKVDGSEIPDAVTKMEIKYLPTFAFIRSGKTVGTHVGGKLDHFKETLAKMKSTTLPLDNSASSSQDVAESIPASREV